ncbi:MAG TPA: hypothetical protein VHI13_22725 [Candidatus Kapabacteria bacterium]|nr:hypothetical protein [Candidatus Kapabacteria bacterium]
MRFQRFAALACVLAAASFIGCGGNKPGAGDEGDSTATMPKEVRIVKGENGAPFPDAKLQVLMPTPNQVVDKDCVMVKVQLTGVDLGTPTEGEQSKGINFSKDGQHIHVIVDDKPYMAMYKTDSFSVGKLSEGIHTLRAFPSRSWHESIKTPGAFVAESFYVKKKTGEPLLKEGAPLLTYSRPKGDYKGKDCDRILLDFYLSNAELGAGKYGVIASIDGQVKDTLREWVPYFIEGLPDGEHTVKLELIGPDGKPVPGAFNSAERKIKVARSEQPAPPMAMPHDTSAPHHDSSAPKGDASKPAPKKKP